MTYKHLPIWICSKKAAKYRYFAAFPAVKTANLENGSLMDTIFGGATVAARVL